MSAAFAHNSTLRTAGLTKVQCNFGAIFLNSKSNRIETVTVTTRKSKTLMSVKWEAKPAFIGEVESSGFQIATYRKSLDFSHSISIMAFVEMLRSTYRLTVHGTTISFVCVVKLTR